MIPVCFYDSFLLACLNLIIPFNKMIASNIFDINLTERIGFDVI